MIRSLSKILLCVSSAVVLSIASVLPARSLSLGDTQKKLEVIAVFALVNDKGEFYRITQGDTLVIPLYLQASAAKDQLEQLLKSQQGLKGRIRAFSLNVFYEQANELRKNAESSGKKLATPIVIPESDMAKAVQILRSEGMPDAKITAGLRTPVFFAEPMLTAKTPNGERQVFFVDYSQLQQGIAALPADIRGGVKERVADLDVILSLIQESQKDQYVFMPSEDYSRLRQEYFKTQFKSQPK